MNAALKLDGILDALADAVAERVLAKLGHALPETDGDEVTGRASGVEPVLIDYTEAAALAGTTVGALEKRVARNRVKGVYRTGVRVQFHRAKFLAGLEKDSR